MVTLTVPHQLTLPVTSTQCSRRGGEVLVCGTDVLAECAFPIHGSCMLLLASSNDSQQLGNYCINDPPSVSHNPRGITLPGLRQSAYKALTATQPVQLEHQSLHNDPSYL